MNPRAIFVAIIALAIIFSALIFSKSDKTHSLLEVVKINLETKYSIAYGSYPQLKYASRAFNDDIKKEIDESIKEHAEMSKNNWLARFEDLTEEEKTQLENDLREGKYEHSITWEPFAFSDKYASILIAVDTYSGGAHGMRYFFALNYDFEKKRKITLADLFPNDPDYLKTISIKSREQLMESLKSDIGSELTEFDIETINKGTAPNEENFKTFVISPDLRSIKIFFAPYQVAAYAFGVRDVMIDL